ncbi:MAG: hypothetical protein KJ077_10375 [Anaerolineae bacterium]|nr:hypothetical protein [Anaerolineae bacterium]
MDIRDIEILEIEHEQNFAVALEELKGVIIAVSWPDGRVTPAVFDRPKFLWVKVYGINGGVFQAFYRGRTLEANTPVRLERPYPNAPYYEITAIDVSSMVDTPAVGDLPALEKHAEQHLPWGNDPLWIYPESLTPLKVTLDSGLKVDIAPAVYYWNYQLRYFPGLRHYDLTAHLPASGYKVQVVIYLDMATTTISSVASDPALDTPTITPFTPLPPNDTIPSALVKLRAGQATLAASDLAGDLRQIIGGNSTGSAYHANAGQVPPLTRLAVPAGRQLVIFDTFTISGQLVLDGTLVVLGGEDDDAEQSENVVLVRRFQVDWNDSTPVTMFTPPANATILRVVARVAIAFDAAGASLVVGVADSTERYVPTGAINLGRAGIYELAVIFDESTSPDGIIGTFDAGTGGSAGRVDVFIYYAKLT